MEKKSLHIASWNINGYKSKDFIKFEDPEFVSLVSDKDIFCLMETHCDLKNCLKVPEFDVINLIRPRSPRSRKRSGGLSIYIKKDIRKGVKFLEHETSDYIWLKLDKFFFGISRHIYICFLYDPPAESTYSRQLEADILSLIEKDISKHSKDGDIILAGDFNARTGDEPDLIQGDSSNHTPLFNSYSPDLDLPSRSSQDNILSQRGKYLIDLCIQDKLRILNGRTFGDTFGQYTSHQPNGSSVIDYFIVSENDCKHGGCPLEPLPPSYIWTDKSSVEFQNVLSSSEIQNDLSNFMKLHVDQTESGINSLINNFNQVIYDVANKSLRKKHHSFKKSNKKKKKPNWENLSLSVLKKHLIDKENLFKKYNKDPYIRSSYFSALKHYRKSRKNTIRLYRQNLVNQLDNLKDNNPKAYWKLLNKFLSEGGDSRVQSQDNISAEEWLNYFRELNTAKDINNQDLNKLLAEAEKCDDTTPLSQSSFNDKVRNTVHHSTGSLKIMLHMSNIKLLDVTDFTNDNDLPENFWNDDFCKVKLSEDLWKDVDNWN
ncbi:unnamed protein product [Mytilus edulis]|uniref:Endonuclease/exonuclease/phosphatase domain-containing protein n=1 Tax=Mytilus edulis TaxID=6550 RepID=A0A8S3RIB3_MYTED|nr:unnamed protein product [Mytilus edulis]